MASAAVLSPAVHPILHSPGAGPASQPLKSKTQKKRDKKAAKKAGKQPAQEKKDWLGAGFTSQANRYKSTAPEVRTQEVHTGEESDPGEESTGDEAPPAPKNGANEPRTKDDAERKKREKARRDNKADAKDRRERADILAQGEKNLNFQYDNPTEIPQDIREMNEQLYPLILGEWWVKGLKSTEPVKAYEKRVRKWCEDRQVQKMIPEYTFPATRFMFAVEAILKGFNTFDNGDENAKKKASIEIFTHCMELMNHFQLRGMDIKYVVPDNIKIKLLQVCQHNGNEQGENIIAGLCGPILEQMKEFNDSCGMVSEYLDSLVKRDGAAAKTHLSAIGFKNKDLMKINKERGLQRRDHTMDVKLLKSYMKVMDETKTVERRKALLDLLPYLKQQMAIGGCPKEALQKGLLKKVAMLVDKEDVEKIRKQFLISLQGPGEYADIPLRAPQKQIEGPSTGQKSKHSSRSSPPTSKDAIYPPPHVSSGTVSKDLASQVEELQAFDYDDSEMKPPSLENGKSDQGMVVWTRNIGRGWRVIVNAGTEDKPFYKLFPGSEFGKGLSTQLQDKQKPIAKEHLRLREIEHIKNVAHVVQVARDEELYQERRALQAGKDRLNGRTLPMGGRNPARYFLVEYHEKKKHNPYAKTLDLEEWLTFSELSTLYGARAVERHVETALEEQEKRAAFFNKAKEMGVHPDYMKSRKQNPRLTRADWVDVPWLFTGRAQRDKLPVDLNSSDAEASESDDPDSETSGAEDSDEEGSTSEVSGSDAAGSEASDVEGSDAEASGSEASDMEGSDAESSDADEPTVDRPNVSKKMVGVEFTTKKGGENTGNQKQGGAKPKGGEQMKAGKKNKTTENKMKK